MENPKLRKAAVLISKGELYLLVKEAAPRAAGKWNWPQGTVEENEEPEDAAIREAQEETGLTIQIERKVAVLTDTFSDTSELHVFLVTLLSETLSLPPKEILAADWFTPSELEAKQSELVGNWILNTIRSIKTS